MVLITHCISYHDTLHLCSTYHFITMTLPSTILISPLTAAMTWSAMRSSNSKHCDIFSIYPLTMMVTASIKTPVKREGVNLSCELTPSETQLSEIQRVLIIIVEREGHCQLPLVSADSDVFEGNADWHQSVAEAVFLQSAIQCWLICYIAAFQADMKGGVAIKCRDGSKMSQGDLIPRILNSKIEAS